MWNLAAPLSVDTARDPSAAERITVGGMSNLLEVMLDLGLDRIMFSDSIGSFGRSSPRDGVSASWLVSNPSQDPGSDYGVQKRKCRELLWKYAEEHNFDTRFVIIPGVLHSDSSWSGGTTEYALDALYAAVKGEKYVCPIPRGVKLPMIHVEDLTLGMVLITRAPREVLREAQCGYCLAGYSFSPEELFEEIQKHFSEFSFSFDRKLNEHAANFAETWPNSLSGLEAERDFGFSAAYDLKSTVEAVLESHLLRSTAST